MANDNETDKAMWSKIIQYDFILLVIGVVTLPGSQYVVKNRGEKDPQICRLVDARMRGWESRDYKKMIQGPYEMSLINPYR